MIAPTTEKGTKVSRSTATLLSPVSPPIGRSETGEVAARDNAVPPRRRATDSAISDHASHAAGRLIPPFVPRPFTPVASATTPLYREIACQALRALVRAEHRVLMTPPGVVPGARTRSGCRGRRAA